MQRRIIGFHLDADGDWVAELDCGHPQHVRHQPPFINRPWVTTRAGRDARLGAELECVRCERFEWPDGFQAYRRTPEFDAETLPSGLRRAHQTRAGVWGRIHVLEGRLRYALEPPRDAVFELQPGREGTVVPEMRHHVEPLGPVRFFVEFFRREETA
jgi:tellurite methyltransferase